MMNLAQLFRSNDTNADLDEAIDVCKRACRGDLEGRIHGTERGDRLGELFRAINKLLDTTDAYVRESTASLEHVAEDKFFRRVHERGLPGSFRRAAVVINRATTSMGKRSAELSSMKGRRLELADAFEHSVGRVTERVAAAAVQMETSASALSETAGRAASASNAGALAATTADGGVRNVASSVTDLGKEIDDIARRVEHSAQISNAAVESVRSTQAAVAEVAQTSRSIGEVVTIIQGVAVQTKLLALNAAVEAARAGEAGAGFGVVAIEVKKLADDASAATDAIRTQITSIQRKTEAALSATTGVANTIGELSAITKSITESASAQRRAAKVIAESASVASRGTDAAQASVKTIAEAADHTGRAASELLRAAGSLSGEAQTLTAEVTTFVEAIRKG